MLPTDAAHFPTATCPSATGPSYFFEQGSAVQFSDAAELRATVTLTSMKVYKFTDLIEASWRVVMRVF